MDGFTPEELESEIWKILPEHTGYRVSNLGRVIGPRGHLMSLIDSGRGGYLAFNTWIDGKIKVVLVHVAVCRLFHGEHPFPEAQALHNNHTLHDCRASNLHWGTQVDNMKEMYKAGRDSAKITWEIAEQIRQEHKEGTKQKELGIKHQLSATAIHNIVKVKTWKTPLEQMHAGA